MEADCILSSSLVNFFCEDLLKTKNISDFFFSFDGRAVTLVG